MLEKVACLARSLALAVTHIGGKEILCPKAIGLRDIFNAMLMPQYRSSPCYIAGKCSICFLDKHPNLLNPPVFIVVDI